MTDRVITKNDFSVYDSNRRRFAIIADAIELYQYRDLLRSLVQRDLTVRYKRSVLGFLWTMLNPLLTMTVMAIVFSTAFRFPIDHYPVYLLSGLLIWNFFSQSTLQSADSLVWGGGLINKIYLPKSIFVVSAVLVGLVNLVLALVPLALIMLLSGQLFSPALLFLPIPIVLVSLFALGIGFVVSALAVFFVDIVDIYRLVLTVLMYLTPIFYPTSIVPEKYLPFIQINPMYYFIQIFRAPIYQGVLPNVGVIALAMTVALATLIVGWWFFTRQSNEFAYRV